MAETSIVFPDLSLMEQVKALLHEISLPASAEFRVEPALDYPGQQVAIDVAATSGADLAVAVETIRDALFHSFRIATHTSDELDRTALARHTA
ncbi:MAG: hypothetical protein ABR616_10470 [Dermatophilaceae bacterium]